MPRHVDRRKTQIESFEPLILMSASGIIDGIEPEPNDGLTAGLDPEPLDSLIDASDSEVLQLNSLAESETLIAPLAAEAQAAAANTAPEFINIPDDGLIELTEGYDYPFTPVAIDAEGDELTYSVVGGPDAELFVYQDIFDVVHDESGFLSFSILRANAPLDANGDSIYEFTVRVSDGELFEDRDIRVEVKAADFTENEVPRFTNLRFGTVIDVVPGQLPVFDADAFDREGNPLRYIMTFTPDSRHFIWDNATGEIFFREPPSFENPLDADGDNRYEVSMTVIDGLRGGSRVNFTVQVNDFPVGENTPPVIVDDISPIRRLIPAKEYENFVTDVDAFDPDGDVLTFEIFGTDANRLQIHPSTGLLEFVDPPRTDTPRDSGGNNVYRIGVSANDGQIVTSANIDIHVMDVDEGANTPPEFTNVAPEQVFEVLEGTNHVRDANATDTDGPILRYAIFGDDADDFVIDDETGELAFQSAPQLDKPIDRNADNIYEVTILATDGLSFDSRDVSVQVVSTLGSNRPPAFTNVSAGQIFDVQEGNDIAVDADAVDPDGDILSYFLDGGTDSWQFGIDSATGIVSFFDTPQVDIARDSDGDNQYELTMGVSDGIDTIRHDIIINVVGDGTTGGENSVPEFTNVSAGQVFDVQEGNPIAIDANAVDADGDILSYFLDGGTDSWQFGIDSATGIVSFFDTPQVDIARDSDGDNQYELTVGVSDGIDTIRHDIIINVVGDGPTGGENSVPEFTNVSAGQVFDVQEGNPIAIDANAVDADGDILSYFLDGGTDSWQFGIDSATGIVSFFDTPQVDIARDSDGDNQYELTMGVSDGIDTIRHDIIINVVGGQMGGEQELNP